MKLKSTVESAQRTNSLVSTSSSLNTSSHVEEWKTAVDRHPEMTKPTAADVSSRLRHERYALAVVFFSLGAVFASWAGRIPQLQEHLGLSDGQLGMSMFSQAVGSLVSMVASAALGARFGTRTMTVLFSVGFCLTLVPLPFAEDWLQFSLCLFLFGFAMGGQDVSMNAHAVHVEREYNRPIMSSFHGTFSLGAMIGGAFSALMCVMQVAPAIHFGIITIFFTLSTIAAAFKIQAPAIAIDETPSPVFVLPSRHIVILAIVAFCSFIGEGAISDWSAVYLAHELNSSSAIAAAGFTTFCLSMTICRFAGDLVVARLGAKKVLSLGGLIAAAGIAASLLLKEPIMVLLSYLLVGVGFSCMVPVSFSEAGRNRHVPASVAIAGVATAGYFGFIIAPPIIGFLADHFTLRTALWLPVALCLIVTALSPWAVRSDESAAGKS